jgi:hypothetical protein
MCQAEAEHLGPSTLLARSYGTTAIVASVAGLHRLARWHCEQSLHVAREVGDRPTLAYVNQLASVYYNGVGEWLLAEQTICEATELNRQLGDRYRWQSCVMIRAYQRMHQGRFAGVPELVKAIRPVAFPDGIVQVRAWCVAVQLISDLVKGTLDHELVEEGIRVLSERVDTSEEILVRGALALAQLHRCNFAEALTQASIASDLIARFPPPTYHTMSAVAAVADVMLSLWASNADVTSMLGADIYRRAATADAQLRRFARRFPFARPRSLLLSGRLAALRGKGYRASRSWRRSIEEATARSMPYEAGLAHLMLGQSDANAEDRNRHETEGRRILAELGLLFPSQT